MAALRLNDARRELDTTEVAITRVRRDDRHVAEQVVRPQSSDALDLVHLVDQRDDRIAPANGEGDLGAARDVPRSGVASGRLDRTLRCGGPHPQQPLGRCGWLRRDAWRLRARRRRYFVPRECTPDKLHLTLLAGERCAAATRLWRWHREHLLDAHAV